MRAYYEVWADYSPWLKVGPRFNSKTQAVKLAEHLADDGQATKVVGYDDDYPGGKVAWTQNGEEKG